MVLEVECFVLVLRVLGVFVAWVDYSIGVEISACLVRAVGLEPTTNGLRGHCSAAELRPLISGFEHGLL